MKKSELIAKLLAIPGDPDVAIFDYITNLHEDPGEGTDAGIYQNFDIDYFREGPAPWIGLSFANEAYVEECDPEPERTCRICGCTDEDCTQCVEKTGRPCSWVSEDLCSACV